MKLKIDQVTIENEKGDGFCYILRFNKNESPWLELHGNDEQNPLHPLCFDSHEDINTFCEKLHILLDGKLLPNGFIKE